MIPGSNSFLRSFEECDPTTILCEDLPEISFFGRSSYILVGRSFEDFRKKRFQKEFVRKRKSFKNLHKFSLKDLLKSSKVQ